MRKYGLDQPLGVQYVRFLGNAARLDFGVSYKYPGRTGARDHRRGVSGLAELGGWALLLALLLGVPLGVVAAVRKNGVADVSAMARGAGRRFGAELRARAAAGAGVLAQAVPVAARAVAGAREPRAAGAHAGGRLLAYIARLTRAGMLEVLRQDYIRTARAKGLSERSVVFKHALKLGMLPVVSYLGPAAARIVTGSIVVESIFAVPGLGRYLVNAAFNRDYTLVLGVVLFYALLLIVLNLVVDVAYRRSTRAWSWRERGPRGRQSGAARSRAARASLWADAWKRCAAIAPRWSRACCCW